MQIKYAVSTMVFWWRENNLSFEQECEFIHNLGYGIEIWPTIKARHDCRYNRRNWPRLQHATENMLVTLQGRKDNPDFDEWTEQIQCAQMLNTCLVTDRQNLRLPNDLGTADWTFAKDVIDLAKDHNVKLCLESGPLSELVTIGDRFNSIDFCLDTGFAHIDPTSSFEDYVNTLAPRTTYLHLTDNYGRLDDHEPPGVRGGMPNSNWTYLLEGLSKYDNNIIASLEMTPAMPGTMIKKASHFLFSFLDWPNPPITKKGTDENSYMPL